MFKYKISFIMCFLLVFVTSATTAFANIDLNIYPINQAQEVNKALSGISDVPITNEIKKSINAEYTYNGVTYPMDINVTISKINNVKNKLNSFSIDNTISNSTSTYAMTVFAKSRTSTSEDSSNNKNIDASGVLTMYWTDNTYPSPNVLDSVAGSWNVSTKGVTVTNRKVSYFIDDDYNAKGSYQPSKNSFNYSIGQSGQKLICKSWIDLKKGTDKAKVSIIVNPVT